MEGRLGILIVEDDLLQPLMLEKMEVKLDYSVLGTTFLIIFMSQNFATFSLENLYLDG